MSNKNKNNKSENFKNSYWILLIAYVIMTVLSYHFVLKQIPSMDYLYIGSRALGGTIAGYLVLPIVPIILSFDNKYCTNKTQKNILIATTVATYIINFYPFIIAIKKIFGI